MGGVAGADCGNYPAGTAFTLRRPLGGDMQNMLGLLPGFRFAIGDNRPERHAETDLALMFCRYFGGSSEAAITVAGKHANVFALWGESLAQTAETSLLPGFRFAIGDNRPERHAETDLALMFCRFGPYPLDSFRAGGAE
jgi:hypothetical protein